MNNYQDQSTSEPVECGRCFNSMTEHQGGKVKYLKCDNTLCSEIKELESGMGELTEAEQYEADANADHVTEQIPNV